MSFDKNDEFYVGYLSEVPAGIAGLIKKVVLALLALAALIAVLLVVNQSPFYPSLFEFGTYRSFEGVIQEKPYPTLLVKRPGEPGKLPDFSQYYLVSFGKFGAAEAVKGLDGQQVTMEGSLIYRDQQTMIEILDGSISQVERSNGAAGLSLEGEGQKLGNFTLIGEIVDSKCFLGVMNPGNLKPHKSCAIRCISGGVPPVFAVQDKNGMTNYFLLLSADGQSVNQQVLKLIAEPVKITGDVYQYGNLLVLRADPGKYELM